MIPQVVGWYCLPHENLCFRRSLYAVKKSATGLYLAAALFKIDTLKTPLIVQCNPCTPTHITIIVGTYTYIFIDNIPKFSHIL